MRSRRCRCLSRPPPSANIQPVRSLVLASTSPYRRALLGRLGLPFECVAPDGVDERAIQLPPRELVVALARAKAEAVAAMRPDAVVIGSDQAPAIGDRVLHKPGTAARAVAQLEALAGREHELLTAVCVIDGPSGRRFEHLDVHRLRLRPLRKAEIEDYVARDQPLDCAGAYKIEQLGIALMERIDGEDATAIVGLPLIAVCRILVDLGLPILGAPP